jgi:hypothetical protein
MGKWTSIAIVAFAFSLPIKMPAQDAASVARLLAAEQAQALDDMALKSWHLKLTVQLYNADKKATGTGTIEEWWAGPNKFRRVFATPSYSATELRNSDSFFRSGSDAAPPFLLARLLEDVVHPIEFSGVATDFSPEEHKQATKTSEMDCFALRPRAKGFSDAAASALTNYCLRDGDTTLLATYDAALVSLPSAVGTFNGRHFPVDLNILINGNRVASEHTDALESVDESAGRFDVTDGLVAAKVDPVQVSSGALAGRLVKSAPPGYSQFMRANHITGTVVFDLVIGSDGKVRNVSMVYASDLSLVDANTMTPLHQWTYRPFVIDGNPVDVETVTTINFR